MSPASGGRSTMLNHLMIQVAKVRNENSRCRIFAARSRMTSASARIDEDQRAAPHSVVKGDPKRPGLSTRCSTTSASLVGIRASVELARPCELRRVPLSELGDRAPSPLDIRLTHRSEDHAAVPARLPPVSITPIVSPRCDQVFINAIDAMPTAGFAVITPSDGADS